MGLLLTACGQGSSTAATTDDTTPPADDTAETTGMFDGFEKEDYNGREFKFLFRTTNEADWYTEEENGDVYNDAVYARNRAVEDEFNIKIVPISAAGEWANRVEYTERIRSSVMADSGDYDLVEMNGSNGALLMTDHLLLNLHEVEHLRLDQPWWSERSMKEMTINGKMYYATGDIAIGMWKCLHVFYFNKELLAEYQLESPYQLVRDGKWTFDKFLQMIEDTAVDLNGDSQMTDEDRYGALFFDSISFENFRVAFDAPISVRKNNTVKLNLMTDEMVSISEKLQSLVHENENVHYITAGDNADASVKLFSEDHALFLVGWLQHATSMRDMKADFGILPYPKADEQQEGYYTMSRANRSMMCMPIDVADAAFSGKITEALCVAGSNLVVPVYHEQVLNGKTSRDDESKEMLEIIRNGHTLDLISDNAEIAGNGGYMLRYAVNGNKALATYYAENESSIHTKFAQFLACFE